MLTTDKSIPPWLGRFFEHDRARHWTRPRIGDRSFFTPRVLWKCQLGGKLFLLLSCLRFVRLIPSGVVNALIAFRHVSAARKTAGGIFIVYRRTEFVLPFDIKVIEVSDI